MLASTLQSSIMKNVRIKGQDPKEENKMLTKEDFETQIVEGIKAGRLDPCNDTMFGEIYTDLPRYYWRVVDNQVVEGSPYYVDEDQSGYHFGISIGSIEGYTEKEFGGLSDDEIKQAMLDIIDDCGTDGWYDEYQQSLETED